MLQFQTTAGAARRSTRHIICVARKSDARLCARRKVPCEQQLPSKVGPRGSSLAPALQAQRGDEAAFLAATDTQAAGALPRPPASVMSRQLQVTSSQGAVAAAEVLPGLTTAVQLREQVAQLLGADNTQVRLSYAGKELPPSLDGSLLQLQPGIDAVAALLRSNDTPEAAAEREAAAAEIAAAKAAAAASAAAAAPPRRTRRRQEEEPPASKLAWAASSAEVGPDRRRAAVKQVPGSRQGATAELQLARQFRDLLRHPIPGVDAAPSDDDLFTWNVKLAGPEGSPYEGGWFDVKLYFTDGFPGVQPRAKFVTSIWHPNVTDPYYGGEACIWLGKDYAHDVCSVACVLTGLQMLLASPNPASPMNPECARQMVKEPAEYEQKARSWTQRFAM